MDTSASQKKKKKKMREYGESYINSKKISDKYTYGKARENLVKSLGYMYIPLNWSITQLSVTKQSQLLKASMVTEFEDAHQLSYRTTATDNDQFQTFLLL